MTVKVKLPDELVSIAEPVGTGPAHVVTAERVSGSVHE